MSGPGYCARESPDAIERQRRKVPREGIARQGEFFDDTGYVRNPAARMSASAQATSSRGKGISGGWL
jgi:hypothetical protein